MMSSSADKGVILAFDMGGSKLAAGLITKEGELLWSDKWAWAPKNEKEVMAALLKAGQVALEENEAIRPIAIGATIPGVADDETGTWVEASFSGIHDFPVARALEDMFGLPAFAANDGQACVLAERLFGAGKDAEDFLYITVSNGIGGGIFSGGRLLRGHGGGAGEIGHCTVVPNGRLCKCGKRGCLEAYAAGPGINKTYKALCGSDKTAEELAHMAKAGDADALRIWEMEGDYLGDAIAFAATLLNPKRVILGGGISLAFKLYEKPLRAVVNKKLFKKPNAGLEILATPLGYHGGLLGAAAVALTKLRKEEK